MLRITVPLCSAARASSPKTAQPLSLKHFILRSQAVSLYRKFVRESRGIGNPQARRETLHWIRDEFDATRGMTDQEQIKDRLQHGHRMLRQLSGPWQLVSSGSHRDLPKLRGARGT